MAASILNSIGRALSSASRFVGFGRQRATAAESFREALAARLLARYDSAATTHENKNHWQYTDNLSAAGANSIAVRRTLRNRSRYECANNCYANGMARTLAYHCVGTGPTLSLDGDGPFERECEDKFGQWAEAVDLASQLRVMREARVKDGEAFAVLTTNQAIPHPIKLSLSLAECDRFTDPSAAGFWSGIGVVPGGEMRRDYNDGITYDAAGNPTSYILLEDHPGDPWAQAYQPPRPIRAEYVFHWFRVDRPGQRRGIPEITPALPLYAILRRYTLAVLSTAEIAALMSLFLKTTSPSINPASVDPYELIDLQRNSMMTLPDGWDVQQLKPEQPTTTHDAFCWTILREIARCLDMPVAIAAGDSSKMNYSSGRLDHQTYYRAIDVDRWSCERVILDRLFSAWLDEALLTEGYFVNQPLPTSNVRSSWDWPPFVHVDPLKESQATSNDLANGLTSLPTELAVRGRRWEREFERAARALGVPVAEYQRLLRSKLFAAGGAPAGDGQQADQQAADQQAEEVPT